MPHCLLAILPSLVLELWQNFAIDVVLERSSSVINWGLLKWSVSFSHHCYRVSAFSVGKAYCKSIVKIALERVVFMATLRSCLRMER